jgi:hypothetical protein
MGESSTDKDIKQYPHCSQLQRYIFSLHGNFRVYIGAIKSVDKSQLGKSNGFTFVQCTQF